jgi:hypothetical protein
LMRRHWKMWSPKLLGRIVIVIILDHILSTTYSAAELTIDGVCIAVSTICIFSEKNSLNN